MERKPTLAFIDNIFHQKTMSSDFFRDLLRPHFEIENYWDRTSQKGPRVAVEEINKHDYVVFWQRLNPITELGKITAKIIWVPMYDSISFDYLFWKNLSFLPIKVICFSKTIYSQCQKFGIKSIYVQYYDKPEFSEGNLETPMKNFFLWQRGPITFQMIKKVIDPLSVENFIFLSRPDPNFLQEKISSDEKNLYKIKTVEMDFQTSKTEYLNMVRQSGIFIASRKKEGIGLGFIEAIAFGCVVVAYNEGTMNEYIKHGYNGYLFDEKTQSPLNFENIKEVAENSKRIAIDGYKQWLADSEKIPEFVLNAEQPTRKHNLLGQLFMLLYKIKLWQFKFRSRYFHR